MHVKLRKGELRGCNSCPLSFARPVKKNLGFDLLIFIVSVGKLFQRGKIYREANIPLIYKFFYLSHLFYIYIYIIEKFSALSGKWLRTAPGSFSILYNPKLYRMDTGQREWLVISMCQQV